MIKINELKEFDIVVLRNNEHHFINVINGDLHIGHSSLMMWYDDGNFRRDKESKFDIIQHIKQSDYNLNEPLFHPNFYDDDIPTCQECGNQDELNNHGNKADDMTHYECRKCSSQFSFRHKGLGY